MKDSSSPLPLICTFVRSSKTSFTLVYYTIYHCLSPAYSLSRHCRRDSSTLGSSWTFCSSLSLCISDPFRKFISLVTHVSGTPPTSSMVSGGVSSGEVRGGRENTVSRVFRFRYKGSPGHRFQDVPGPTGDVFEDSF